MFWIKSHSLSCWEVLNGIFIWLFPRKLKPDCTAGRPAGQGHASEMKTFFKTFSLLFIFNKKLKNILSTSFGKRNERRSFVRISVSHLPRWLITFPVLTQPHPAESLPLPSQWQPTHILCVNNYLIYCYRWSLPSIHLLDFVVPLSQKGGFYFLTGWMFLRKND